MSEKPRCSKCGKISYLEDCMHCKKKARANSRTAISEKNIIELLKIHLDTWGYDGLYAECGECACQISDLVPCESDFSTCKPGYKTKCHCGEGCDFHISKEKERV